LKKLNSRSNPSWANLIKLQPKKRNEIKLQAYLLLPTRRDAESVEALGDPVTRELPSTKYDYYLFRAARKITTFPEFVRF
jgi:hypothetical protein